LSLLVSFSLWLMTPVSGPAGIVFHAVGRLCSPNSLMISLPFFRFFSVFFSCWLLLVSSFEPPSSWAFLPRFSFCGDVCVNLRHFSRMSSILTDFPISCEFHNHPTLLSSDLCPCFFCGFPFFQYDPVFFSVAVAAPPFEQAVVFSLTPTKLFCILALFILCIQPADGSPPPDLVRFYRGGPFSLAKFLPPSLFCLSAVPFLLFLSVSFRQRPKPFGFPVLVPDIPPTSGLFFASV